MQYEELRALLSPHISEPDALLQEFKAASSLQTSDAFFAWWLATGRVSPELVKQLASRLPYLKAPSVIDIPAPPPGLRTATPAPMVSRTPSYPPKASLENSGAPMDIPGRGYKFIGKIGEGAMGEVLLAKDLDLHRTVAYKAMNDTIAQQKSLGSKFYGEAQITAQLDHPSIVPLYSLARTSNGTLAYTMKYVRGKTLETILQETREQYQSNTLNEAYSLQTRLEQFLKVCDAIHYAHSRGVVHRDLKPENIMIGAYGEVYVMDWGIARLMEVSGSSREDIVMVEGYQPIERFHTLINEDQEDLSENSIVIGTPQYMSPEQASGQPYLDGRSDLYSLGLILYEIVSLRQAVTGKTAIKIVMRQQDGEKDPLIHSYKESISVDLKAIIDKATAKHSADRYDSVARLADDIRRFLRGEAILARPDRLRQKVMRWVGRHRELTLTLLFLAVTFAGTVATVATIWTVYSSAMSAKHEQKITQLLTSNAAQAAGIDSQFARLEGLLGIIAASSSEMLIRGKPTEEPLFFSKDFQSEQLRPKDMKDSARYGTTISLDQPVLFVPSTVDASQIQYDFQRLTPMHRYFKRVMLLSRDEQSASAPASKASRLIREVGTPVAWIQIGLANGGYIGYPGQATFPEGFDPRQRPWYTLASKNREATWGAPYIDSAGLGPLLPCVVPLYDEAEKPNLLGAVAIDLTFDYIIEKLLLNESLPAGAESFLLDQTGKVVIRSSEQGKKFEPGSVGDRTIRMPDFPVPAVISAIQKLESGKVEAYNSATGQMDLVVYNRMNSLGWYYVVRGPPSVLLSL